MRAPLLVFVFATVLVAALGCQSATSHPAPRVRFHFPTGVAVDVPYSPDGGPAHFLYLAGFTNFDLAADDALVYALSLDAMNPEGTGLLPPGLADDAGWDGTPLQIPDLDGGDYWDRANGVVTSDSMGGEMRLATTSEGNGRLFLASRYSNVVTAIDVDGGSLACYGGGSECDGDPIAAPPLVIEQSAGANQVLDVFGVSNEIVTQSGERDVFITHLRDQAYGSGGVVSSGSYGNNTSQTGTAYLIRQNVDDPSCRLAEPIGTVGGSSSVALANGGITYPLFTGRYGGLTNAVRELILPDQDGGCVEQLDGGQDAGLTPVDPLVPDLFTIDLGSITKGNDGRGMALSSNQDRVFALIRNPDAVVVLRSSGFEPYGLLIHPSSATPVPPGPTQILAIPRTAPGGGPLGDLVAITCADSNLLAFYDDELGQVTAALPGVGNEPFGIAAVVRTSGVGASAQILPGVRLFVSAFGSGQVAVVDVPDLLDAQSAQVVAMIGTPEDTTISPINPNSNIFTVPIGAGPTGIP